MTKSDRELGMSRSITRRDSMGQNLLFDPDWSEDEYPWVVGRKRFGRITIANSDAEGVCLTQASFDQAHRAVDELMRRDVAWWNRV